MRNAPPAWVETYIGIPFEDRGRGPAAFDCWGLVREVLGHQFGQVVPSWDDGYVNTEDGAAVAGAVAAARGHWDEVTPDQARPGDVVLLRARGRPSHVGVLVSRSTMLHTLPESGAVLERVDAPRWTGRLDGYFRWRGAL